MNDEQYIECIMEEWLNDFIQIFAENDSHSPFFEIPPIPPTFVHGGSDAPI